MEISDYYLPVRPYSIADRTVEFIAFIKKVFGAEERLIVPHKIGTIMHAEFSLGKATIMFAAADETYKPFPRGMLVLQEDIDVVYQQDVSKRRNLVARIRRSRERQDGWFSR